MIETARLRLRRWRMAEARDYRRIASEPRVALTLGKPPTLARARAIVAAQNATLDALGHCFWAAERRSEPGVIGWCGLKIGPDHTPIFGEPEIGWTLDPDVHGQGLAREAAAAVLGWAWAHTAYCRIYAITSIGNAASRGVMAAIGMTQVAGAGFDHPALTASDPLRPHVTYAVERPRTSAASH